jgi:hypothetical protein
METCGSLLLFAHCKRNKILIKYKETQCNKKILLPLLLQRTDNPQKYDQTRSVLPSKSIFVALHGQVWNAVFVNRDPGKKRRLMERFENKDDHFFRIF